MAEGELGQKNRPVATLTGLEIVAIAGLQAVWLMVLESVLTRAGFFTWFYGPTPADADPAARALAVFRQRLWVTSFALPLQVATALAMLHWGLRFSLADLGLTVRHLARQVAAGFLFALVFVPGAYAILALANVTLQHFGSAPQDHPLSLLGQQPLHPVEWGLLIFGAVVAAPLWEELIFRGLVQPWILSRPRWGGLVALALALTLAVFTVYDRHPGALTLQEWLLKLAPAWTLGLLAGLFLLIDRFRPDWAGLFAAAVLFGWVHVGVWPSPIPLVWLAMGLGWLAWRGKSLAGPIVLHALFNAFACAMLLRGT